MRILLFLVSCWWADGLVAQSIYLQLEKTNSAKTKKYTRGDAFEYRTTDDPEWQLGRIERLVPEEELIIFQNRYVALAEITDLRHAGPRRWSVPAGASLITFGATWGALSVISGVFDRETDPLTPSDGVVALGSAGLGLALLRLFRYRKYPLGRRYRLRLLDLRALDRRVTD